MKLVSSLFLITTALASYAQANCLDVRLPSRHYVIFADEHDKNVFARVKSGEITATIRKGQRCFLDEQGNRVSTIQVLFRSGRKTVEKGRAQITTIQYKQVANLTLEDARRAGFAKTTTPIVELKKQLKHFYKNLLETDMVTVIRFQYL